MLEEITVQKITRQILIIGIRKAKNAEELDWCVKVVCIYFSYNEDYYVMRPGCINTTPEILDRLAREREDALYEIGIRYVLCRIPKYAYIPK